MSDDMKMQGSFSDTATERVADAEGILGEPLDPLQLEIDDEDLVDIVDSYSDDYTDFYTNEYDLFERRKKNELFLFGRQIQEKEKEKLLKNYESHYLDNVLYEIEGTIKPLVMTRLPDLLVTPGNDSDEATLVAQEVSKAVDTQIKDRNNRKVLGLASKHLPIYFTAVIKSRWDPEIDDYVYENIHPDLIEVDYTCTTNDADKMKYVSQYVPLTVQQILLRFPKKKEEFLEQLKKDGLLITNDPDWSLLASVINIREVWFDEYVKHTDKEAEKVSGLLWKYKSVILDKMKNPNFDYEGETKYFATDPNTKEKRDLSEQEINFIMMTGQIPSHINQEKTYNNYFKTPRKPFYFMGYDQWGKQPYDETSRVEQNLQMQESLDKRGKQLEETLDNRGHHIFSKLAGLTPADIEELDNNDPDEDLVVDGNVNETHAFIAPERPSQQEFEEMTNIRNRMYAISHSNAVRGQIQTSVGITNQIAREGDFTAADDLTEDTINDAAQWMADWAMQFIKLRYTVDHFRDILGDAGEAVWIKLNRNMISDGMVVKIKASGTDKLRAQNNAMEMAKMQMTDPYTFFVDMGLSDPEGRTERLIMAKADPVAYLQKVVKGVDTSTALAEMLMRKEQEEVNKQAGIQPPPATPSPTMAGAPPMGQSGQTPSTMGGAPQAPQGGIPQQGTAQNTSAVPFSPPNQPPNL